jgi:hypothetical protein
MRSTVHERVMLALTLIASVSLGGCGSSGFGGIRGPSAVLQSTEVLPASTNTRLIVEGLARDNNIPVIGVFTSPLYYDVSVAGFNFIDDQCATYFDKLFFVQRDRQFGQQVLAAGSAAAGAILALTGASTITFGAVATAFGFSSTVVDSVAGSFLFQLPPATTYGFVKELQTAYRSGVNAREVQSSADAYHLMQDYLAICLPPNIEARLVERVANTRALPQSPVGSNGSPSIQLADKFTQQTERPQRAAQVTSQALPHRASENVGKPPGPRPFVKATGWEVVSPTIPIDAPTARAIQRSLCLPESPDGSFTSETELGLKVFSSVNNHKTDDPQWRAQSVTLTEPDIVLLRNVNRCSPGAKNYLESSLLRSQGPGAADLSAKIREKFNITDANKSFPDLRPQIMDWRKQLNLDNGPNNLFIDQITPDFVAKAVPIQD